MSRFSNLKRGSTLAPITSSQSRTPLLFFREVVLGNPQFGGDRRSLSFPASRNQMVQRHSCHSNPTSEPPPFLDSEYQAIPDDPNDMVLKPNIGPEGFPPLPPIKSHEIRQQVFTHRSFFARPGHVFEDPPHDPSPDNEMLEHLGDSVLGLVVTGHLRDTYKNLHVGPATKIRALVVGNATLARISVLYGLPSMLRLHRAQAITLQASVNIQADVFESYVGGLYTDQGLETTKKWLIVLLRPYVAEAYRVVRNQHGLPPQPAIVVPDVIPKRIAPPQEPPPTPTIGHLALFNQYMQQRHHDVEWRYTKNDKGAGSVVTPIWFVQAMLNETCLASGRGYTKKAARDEAAKEGLAKLGVPVVQ